ncbi:DNA repair protein RecO [Desulfobulbus sp.]|uniref:DNA repair protein RecO n=1 Tax=Desulfobulbus sp. TaxID=895 RepID=UPI00286F64DC|nr:DNA repair protein RecO [Desulfobulbus sp.]
MNLGSTCGIVLRVVDYGEADKLVTLYCPDLGRVTGIAKGAKKSKHRFVNKLEEFSLLHFFYRPPRGPAGLLLISEAELLAAHVSLRIDFRRYAAAMYLGELTLRFTRDNDPDRRLYILLKWALAALDRGKTPQQIATLFHLHLLETVGYRPELDRCAACHQSVLAQRRYIFLPGSGSLLCDACAQGKTSHALRLSVQTIRLLASAQSFELDRLYRLRFSQQALGEAMMALYHFTLHLLQQDVHSWRLLRPLLDGPSHRDVPTSEMPDEKERADRDG